VEGRIQASSEDARQGDTITFYDRQYRISDRVALLPLLEFANAADNDMDSGDMEGMAALYRLIRSCFYRGEPACGQCEHCTGQYPEPKRCQYYKPGDWEKFKRHATDVCADEDDILDVVREVIEVVSARPTRPRSGSSPPGPGSTASSKELSSSPAPAGPRVPPGAEGLIPVGDLAR
jgi:hypothetical protein